jgi:hypothetical protein
VTDALTLVNTPAPPAWTERLVLDALHLRLCAPVNGAAQRYALAEHARLDPTWGHRILDAVAVDTWASTGYGLDGYEVKVSRGDLRRELADLTKAGAWDDVLDTFSIVAPRPVLTDWQAFGMPDDWGVMAASEGGSVRWLRKPTRRTNQPPVRRPVVAGLARAIAQTATRQCVRHANAWGVSA